MHFLEKANKIGKNLIQANKKQKRKESANNIGAEKGNITTDVTKHKGS